jgi:hypothetical protein
VKLGFPGLDKLLLELLLGQTLTVRHGPHLAAEISELLRRRQPSELFILLDTDNGRNRNSKVGSCPERARPE